MAKGQIVREIDAGMTGLVTDESAVQFRMLNLSKGPAMVSKSTKRQNGFAEKWRLILERNKNVDFWQEMIVNIIVKKTRLLVLKRH